MAGGDVLTTKNPVRPYLQDPDFTLWHGDVREVLPRLEAESVDCALTSPPFYALRDYGVEGQIGLEATPEEWVAELVGVFRELRRVLKSRGTLWVECGDSYAAGGLGAGGSDKQASNVGANLQKAKKAPPGYKPKDILGTPWLLAFALRADGWYWRQTIIWSKSNAMPESVGDRCTTAHSYVLLFSKSPRYFFDAEAIAEPAEWARWGDQTTPKYEGTDTASGWMQPRTREQLAQISRPQTRRAWELFEQRGLTEAHLDAIRACDVSDTGKALVTTNGVGRNTDEMQRLADEAKVALGGYYREFLIGATRTGSKNARSVWTIPTQGFPEAHFATFPEVLVERIIKAGCPEWVCGTCGKARERIIETVLVKHQRVQNSTAPAGAGASGSMGGNRARDGHVSGHNETTTLGWSDCGHGNYIPGTVLDPFMGSGTTALVARRLGCRSVGIELNEEYAAMAARRLQQQSLFAETEVAASPPAKPEKRRGRMLRDDEPIPY